MANVSGGHRINSVQNLYDDAKTLYTSIVTGGAPHSADSIISNLKSGIEILENAWLGKDAGVQIQNLVVVHNAMVAVRNSLGFLAETTTKIAANYREIQNSNGAGLETLVPITNENSTVLANYTDIRDTVNISPEANNGKQKIDTANSEIDNFVSKVRTSFDLIMNNWTEGPGRNEFQDEFNTFVNSVNKYKSVLNEATTSISTAIANYGM